MDPASVKRMSEANLKRIVGTMKKEPNIVNWHKTNILIKEFLPLKEYMELVHSIINKCLFNNGSENTVATELVDFSIRCSIINAYASVELPKDLDELFYIVCTSDLFDTVCENANKAQIDMIINSVWRYLNIGEGAHEQ